jgi:hypothetical protein
MIELQTHPNRPVSHPSRIFEARTTERDATRSATRNGTVFGRDIAPTQRRAAVGSGQMATPRTTREPPGAPDSPSDAEQTQTTDDGVIEAISAFKIAERRKELHKLRHAPRDVSGYVAVACWGLLTTGFCGVNLWSARFHPSNDTIRILGLAVKYVFGGAALYWHTRAARPILWGLWKIAVITCEERLVIVWRNVGPFLLMILQALSVMGALGPFKAIVGFVKGLYDRLCSVTRDATAFASQLHRPKLFLGIATFGMVALSALCFLIYLHFT